MNNWFPAQLFGVVHGLWNVDNKDSYKGVAKLCCNRMSYSLNERLAHLRMVGSGLWKCRAYEGTRRPVDWWELSSQLRWHWTFTYQRFDPSLLAVGCMIDRFQLRRGMVATSPQGEQPVACLYFQVSTTNPLSSPSPTPQYHPQAFPIPISGKCMCSLPPHGDPSRISHYGN